MTQINKPVCTTGGCLCGAVRYRIKDSLRPVVYCHCTQCRSTSGHFVAATAVLKENLELVSEQGLAWYQSSASARRGFCRICGSSLFWFPVSDSYISIMAGTLDQPTGIKAAEHIYVEFKADYYELKDGLPQSQRWFADGAPAPECAHASGGADVSN